MQSLDQYVALSRRALRNTIRQPAAIVPSILFPLLFLVLSTSAMERSTTLPGFPPVDSFMQFLIATTIIQGSLFGSIDAGSAMAADIEGGFFERLIASPVARTSIVVGRVTSAAALAFAQTWLYFAVAELFGLDVGGGVLAMLLVAVVSAVFGAGMGAITVAFGLKTGSTEAVEGAFPLLFALLLLSSAFFPRDLMDGWFRSVADANPLSHLIEGLRAQVIEGLDMSQFLTALAVAGGIFLTGVAASLVALNKRLAARA